MKNCYVINIIVLGWMMVTPQALIPSDVEETIEIPFYYSIQDQLLADEGIIMEMHGTFGIDNPFSRHLGATLLQQYTYVTAIAQPNRKITTLIATHTLPLSHDDLTGLLHDVGQTNFIIFDTETVQAISQLP